MGKNLKKERKVALTRVMGGTQVEVRDLHVYLPIDKYNELKKLAERSRRSVTGMATVIIENELTPLSIGDA